MSWLRRVVWAATEGWLCRPLALALLGAVSWQASAQSDTAAPVLRSLTFSPTMIDVGFSAQTVTVTVRFTDDLSGLLQGCMSFISPSQAQQRYACFGDYNRISGTALDGVYHSPVSFPQASEAGMWQVYYAYGQDAVGNFKIYYTQELIGLGIAVNLQVTSTADIAAPLLLTLSFVPGVIDVSSGSQTVTVTVRFTDNLSGLLQGCMSFISPSQAQQRYACFGDYNRISGTALDGIYQSPVSFPQFSEAGTWQVYYVYGQDAVGNFKIYYTQELIGLNIAVNLQVASNSDTAAPVLQSLTFVPGAIDVSSSSQSVTVTVRLTDNLSGLVQGCMSFISPSQAQQRYACFGDYNRISGSALDGVYQSQVSFPRYSEAGTWRVYYAYGQDAVGNFRIYYTQELINLGIAVDLLVSVNSPPAVNAYAASVTVDEGATATNTGSYSDLNVGDNVTLSASVGAVSKTGMSSGTWTWSLSTTDGPAQSQTVAITANDGNGGIATTTFSLTVKNVAPVVAGLTGPSNPIPVGSSASIAANYTDAGSGDSHTCTFSWDGAGPDTTAPGSGSGSGSCTASQTFATPGVYSVQVTVTDDDSGSTASTFEFVVVFDPSAGFITGGGWIDSPPGAYVAQPTLTGKASFGFVARYQKGANTPTGQTEFQFHVANFNFNSTLYQWLVVAGAKAQYKGYGTVNGAGEYGFLLTAVDGQLPGGGGQDKLRMKIWSTATNGVVYDNVAGAPEDIDKANPQILAGGSIVIHP